MIVEQRNTTHPGRVRDYLALYEAEGLAIQKRILISTSVAGLRPDGSAKSFGKLGCRSFERGLKRSLQLSALFPNGQNCHRRGQGTRIVEYRRRRPPDALDNPTSQRREAIAANFRK